MHPSVQNGNNINDMVVPYLFSSELFSHNARPQPCCGSSPSRCIVCTMPWYSPYAGLPSYPEKFQRAQPSTKPSFDAFVLNGPHE